MSNRRWVFIIMAALLLLLTTCSSGPRAMDGEDMVRSYTQISQEEAKPDNLEGAVPAPADALVGEFDFSAERVLLNSGWEMPIIGTGTWTLSDEEAENSTYYALKSGMRRKQIYEKAAPSAYLQRSGFAII